MNENTFPEKIDEIESILMKMNKMKRQKEQYDEETVLTMTPKQRDLILRNLRIIEREYYKNQ